MLTAVNFGVFSVALPHIAAAPFHDIDRVIPTLQVAAAKFSLGILLVAGTLKGFLILDFVVRQLGGRTVFSLRHDSGGALRNREPRISRSAETGCPVPYAQPHILTQACGGMLAAGDQMRLDRRNAPVAPSAPSIRAPQLLPNSISISPDICS